MGEKTKETLKLQFDKRLRLEFHGVRMPHRELKWGIPIEIGRISRVDSQCLKPCRFW